MAGRRAYRDTLTQPDNTTCQRQPDSEGELRTRREATAQYAFVPACRPTEVSGTRDEQEQPTAEGCPAPGNRHRASGRGGTRQAHFRTRRASTDPASGPDRAAHPALAEA